MRIVLRLIIVMMSIIGPFPNSLYASDSDARRSQDSNSFEYYLSSAQNLDSEYWGLFTQNQTPQDEKVAALNSIQHDLDIEGQSFEKQISQWGRGLSKYLKYDPDFCIVVRDNISSRMRLLQIRFVALQELTSTLQARQIADLNDSAFFKNVSILHKEIQLILASLKSEKPNVAQCSNWL